MTRRVVRATDLKPPRAIASENFDLIFRTFKIPREQQDGVRDFLADAVAVFREVITDERALPTRKADRLAVTGAIDNLGRAAHQLKRVKGPAGRRALHLSGRQIARVVSDAWLQSRFPNDFEAPSEVYPPANYNPSRLRPRDLDWLDEAENQSIANRVDFMGRRGATTILKLLSDVFTALDAGRRLIVQLPDGRKPLRHRKYMLAALAQLWSNLGRRPTSGANSHFGAFCEVVFEAIGWPTEGVNSALPSAILLWRRLYR
jgi:hypothetical protein